MHTTTMTSHVLCNYMCSCTLVMYMLLETDTENSQYFCVESAVILVGFKYLEATTVVQIQA